MSRSTSGWFKCWRSAWDKDLGENIYLWGLWHALLHIAFWKESQKLWNGHQRVLPPGTVIFSPKEISQKWGCSKSVIQKWLKHLHDTGRIVVESCPRGTLVTICNWELYQSSEDEACSPRGHGVVTACSPRGTHEEREEDKEEYIGQFKQALAEYKRLPGVQKGARAEKRFREQITSEDEFKSLIAAIENYRTFLSWSENNWRKPKTTFETFLGSKSSGFFWRDFIELPARAAGSTCGSATPLHLAVTV